MKRVLTVSISFFLFSAALLRAQASGTGRTSPTPGPGASLPASSPASPSSSSSSSPVASAPLAANLDSVLTEIQQATQSANEDIARLKIDRWKTDSTEKAQQQQVADSLRKNITNAVPDLITDVRSSHGSVSSTFRLYHNVNVVFEYLNQLTDAAGSIGKKEEFEPLNNDTAALDKARQHLSAYIEQAAANLESKVRAALAAATPTPVPQVTPKKIIVDDDTPKKPATSKKKKTSTPAAQPSATPN